MLATVSEATGIPRRNVASIVGKGPAVESGARTSLETPKRDIAKPSLKSTIANFGEEVIRRIVHNFHAAHKQRPTVKAVCNEVMSMENLAFSDKIASLRRLLLKLGFRWKKTTDNRKLLMEKSGIRELRCAYIRNMGKYPTQDETYIHSSHTAPYKWTDGTHGGVTCPITKGKRLIIVHADGEQVFVSNTLLIFKSGQTSGDYHDDMNQTNYKQWLETSLLRNLPERSVLAVDNASYHNVLSVRHPKL